MSRAISRSMSPADRRRRFDEVRTACVPVCSTESAGEAPLLSSCVDALSTTCTGICTDAVGVGTGAAGAGMSTGIGVGMGVGTGAAGVAYYDLGVPEDRDDVCRGLVALLWPPLQAHVPTLRTTEHVREWFTKTVFCARDNSVHRAFAVARDAASSLGPQLCGLPVQGQGQGRVQGQRRWSRQCRISSN